MPLNSYENISEQQIQDRYNAAKEIVDSEKVYVTSLKKVSDFNIYLQNGKLIDEQMLSDVFGNITSLYRIGSTICGDLEKEVANHNGDYNQSNIGSVISHLAGFLKFYTVYINGYDKSIAVLGESTKKKDVLYSEWIKAIANDTFKMDLSSYLIMPVQRIPRYRLLLQRLLKYTPTTNNDYNDITKALDSIEKIATMCDSAMRPDLNRVFNEIHYSLGYNINLINVRRKLVEHTEATLLGFQSETHVFLCLFNDMLLIYTKNAGAIQVLYIMEYICLSYVTLQPEDIHALCIYDHEKACSVQFSDKGALDEFVRHLTSFMHNIRRSSNKCSYCGSSDMRESNESMDINNPNLPSDCCLQCHKPVCRNCSSTCSYFDLEQLKEVTGLQCNYCAHRKSAISINNHISTEEKDLPAYWTVQTKLTHTLNPVTSQIQEINNNYYANQIAWKSTYKHPQNLPVSEERYAELISQLPTYWKVDFLNDDNSTPFYFNILTNETQWEKPMIKTKTTNNINTDLIRICLKCHKVYPDDGKWESTCSNCHSRLPFPSHYTSKEISQ